MCYITITDSCGKRIQVAVSEEVYEFMKEDLSAHWRYQTESKDKLRYFDTETWNNAAFLAIESISAEDEALGCQKEAERLENDCYRKRLAEYQELLPELKAACTEKQWRRFVLHQAQGKTLREIAAVEGCSFAAVSYSVQAAKEKIKKVLGKRG